MYFDAKEKVLLELQRAAALSLSVGYEGCPILSAYARKVLRNTAGVQPRFGDGAHPYHWDELWEMGGDNWRTATKDKVVAVPNACDRLLMHKVFGITVEDQLILEEFFDKCDDRRWSHPVFAKYIPKICLEQRAKQLCSRFPDRLVVPRV